MNLSPGRCSEQIVFVLRNAFNDEPWRTCDAQVLPYHVRRMLRLVLILVERPRLCESDQSIGI